MTATIVKYSKPFIMVETREATRLLNENAIKEIIPLEQRDLARLMEVIA